MDVKSGVELVKKLAFKDNDITLGTKALARAPIPKKGFLGFCKKDSFSRDAL